MRAVLGVCEPLVVDVRGFAERVVGPGDVVAKPLSIGLSGGHVGDVGTVVGVVVAAGAAGQASTAVPVALVLEALEGRAEVCGIWGVGVDGGCLKGGKDAGEGLLVLSCCPLGGVIFCVGAGYSEHVQVLVAV